MREPLSPKSITMKLRSILLIATAATVVSACSSEEPKNKVEAKEKKEVAKKTAESVAYNINIGESTVMWEGKKTFVVDYKHGGTINLTAGELTVKENNIESGNFTLDMASIAEVGGKDAESSAQLAGHLMSGDFFDVEQFPTATFEITGASAEAGEDGATHKISGNLTIKGQGKNIEFPAKVTIDGDKLTASANFTIDRSQWGIAYGSNSLIDGLLDDQVIDDNISYEINLVANKKS